MIPKYPFILTCFGPDKSRQDRSFETLEACVEASRSLHARSVASWQISVVLATGTILTPNRNQALTRAGALNPPHSARMVARSGPRSGL